MGTGIAKAQKCRIRISELEDARAILGTLKQRLAFTLATPKELLQEIYANKRFNRCRYIAKAVSCFDELGFEKAWINALNKSEQAFEKEDISVLRQLSSILGRSDLMTQQQQMEQLLQQLDKNIENARKQSEEKQRMYISLGTLSGFIAAVILI